MFSFQPKVESQPTFEDVFFEHHARLSEWAFQLTSGDHSDAEDLVQELYVRISGLGPVGEHIASAEDYVFSTLRNLYYSRARRARANGIDGLSIVDYDSVERSLRAVDRNGVLFIREDLHRVCDYLCERKESSRAAGIFILRYFLGYFPNEVMQVVRATRVAVDKAIQAIRREARLDLKRPGVLQGIRARQGSKFPTSRDVDDSQGLFAALRAKIFRSNTGNCFALGELEARYAGPRENFTTAELAHLVSCFSCLDRTNRLLGLPLLEERSPDEVISRDTPSGPSGSTGGAPALVSSRPRGKRGDTQRLRRQMTRHLEEVKQHRPQHLLIAVDGDLRASQKVTGEYSELRAELRPMEKPTFIEVLSEQGICLGFVSVQALGASAGLRQIKEIDLSDNRKMSVALYFAAESPTIQVIYNDPLLALEDHPEEGETEPPPGSIVALDRAPSLFSSWQVQSGGLLERLWRRTGRILSLNMNPLLASAVLCGICSVICLLLWMRSGPGISSETMLSRAEQSDVAELKTGQPVVIYQKVRISGPGRVVERTIYRDPRRKHRFKQDHLSSTGQSLKDNLTRAGVGWDEPLSAMNYREWHDHVQFARDSVRETGQNLLTLITTVPNGNVAQESLTVRKSDFHPIARGVILRDQGQGSTTIEIAELSYAVLDPRNLSPALFEDTVPNPVPPHAAVLPPFAHLPSAAELDMAELQVRQTLHELGADLGEDIHVERSPRNIEVFGVVSTSERARSLHASLYALPHVVLALRTPQELRAAHIASIRSQLDGDSPSLQPALLDEILKQEFPNESERTSNVNRLLADADQCAMRSQALDVLLQRYHTLDDATVKKIADDHMRALIESSTAITGWIDKLSQYPDEQQEDSVQINSPLRGTDLVEASRSLEHGIAELVTAHATEKSSSPSTAAVIANCRRQLKTIQRFIAALR